MVIDIWPVIAVREGKFGGNMYEEILWSEGNMIYLNLGGSHTSVYICRNSLNCVQTIYNFTNISYNSIVIMIKYDKTKPNYSWRM